MLRKSRRLLAWGSAALVGLDGILVVHQSVDLGRQVLAWIA